MAKKTKPNFLSEGLNLPKVEEKVLKFWEEEHTFEKSLKKRQPSSAKATAGKRKTFVFFEGPPTANGKPGIHHVLARAFKDIILRYRTMQGFYVPRKAGWDTHGLPVELEVEKKLGLKSKKDIEEYGIAEFNEKCRESVWEYKDEWERLTKRIGFWLEMDKPYITYATPYMETLWWIISQIYKKKLMYKGHKIVPWCTRCGTSLSSHELGQPGAYKEVTENSVYMKFKLEPGQKIGKFLSNNSTYILSWTTTPWTLPGNVALAVGEDIKYSGVHLVKNNKITENAEYEPQVETFILATDRLNAGILNEPYTEDFQIKGKELLNLEYEPLFGIPFLKYPKAYKIYAADFVTTTDGTGVVHTAVMYGEDDYVLGQKIGLPQKHTVSEEGKFLEGVPDLEGLYVKSKETEEKIFAHLQDHNNLLRTEFYKHEYPHCWRCGTPLLYYARDSWFVAVSKIKPKLLAANKNINWVPEHLKNGRFGEWLKEIKDWNFSRERYWGTPLPLWECEKCGHIHSVAGIADLLKSAPKSLNKYWIIRHGEAEGNVKGIIDSGDQKFHLTMKGKGQVKKSAAKLKSKKIDMIVSSDMPRAKETAEILAENLKIKEIIFDKRLREINLGSLSGSPVKTYWETYPTYESRFEKRPPEGESLRDVRTRTWDLMAELEEKYKNKKILIVSHEDDLWMISQSACGWSEEETIRGKSEHKDIFINLAEVRPLEIKNLPRNKSGEVDLHRPYIDEVILKCQKCAGKSRRVKEVADVWFDSGSMPFAQLHYPFENRALVDKNKFFPADYISEAMDQTRGWFYTLLAVSVLLDEGAPYKNVISLGLINDKNGQKMSKSKGNVVSPWDMADKYGVDAVRWYFYSATPPGEPKNFDENEVQKIFRKFHLILFNSLVFYETYGVKGAKKTNSKNILDKWIISRLNETILKATESLESYDIRSAALALESLTDDLSRWYIRRSRRRFQPARGGQAGKKEKDDHEAASVTLRQVLLQITKLIGPFTPFFAEAMYSPLGDEESVHLEDWPKADKRLVDKKLNSAMVKIRNLASDALAKRAEAGIKVRQPLKSLEINNAELKSQKELLEILKDEVNVKEIIVNPKSKEEIKLDTKITRELREEGNVRELVRLVQGLRQEAGYSPKDKIRLYMESSNFAPIFQKFEKELKAEVGADSVEYKKTEKFDVEANSKIEEQGVWVGIKKV